MENISAPHIGQLLRAYVKKHRIYQSGWARKAGLNPRTIAQYLRQPTMQVDTLFKICQTLNYNFLREIAATLPPEMPPLAENPLAARVAELERKNQDLELQLKTLREAFGMLGSR